MFTRHQILTWSCPLRSLLLLRESCLSAVSVHTGSGWQRVRHVKERQYEKIRGKASSDDGSSLPTETVCCSTQLSSSNLNCDKYQLRENLCESLLSKAILLSCHHHHAERADRGCLINMACLRHWRSSWDFCQPSLSCTSKIQCNLPQNNLHHILHFLRPFSLSTHPPWSLNYSHSRQQCPSLLFHHTRNVHQAAPRVADTMRDCLSPVNENRCRQSLGPNLKLYQLEKERKGGSHSQGKNQARWASVLVSLCSYEAEPAFLFTLRSSTLKGRHKGDVSFAGGKSDPSDGDVVATALREAQEELGIKVTAEQVWGVLKPLRDASGMMVAPVLANLGPLEELTFKPNPGEVEEIFTLSLSHLCNPQNRGYTHFRTGSKYGYTLPVFRNGKHRVWGLTAVALDHTLKLIVPP